MIRVKQLWRVMPSSHLNEFDILVVLRPCCALSTGQTDRIPSSKTVQCMVHTLDGNSEHASVRIIGKGLFGEKKSDM